MNSSTPPSKPGSKLKLEQLILLHEEILALVRAKVPLAEGLQMLGGELHGNLGRIARSLSASVSRGVSLEEALDQHGAQFPMVYRAVVRAGLRSGRLNLALESLSVSLLRIRDVRESVKSGMIYPILVVCLTVLLSMFFGFQVAPRIFSIYHDFGGEVPGPLGWAKSLGLTPSSWKVIGFGLLLLLLLLVRQGKRSLSLGNIAALSGVFALLPWSRRMMRATRAGMFVEILGLLLKNQVPLGESLQIAAESIGDLRLTEGCRRLNESIQRGEKISGKAYREIGLPPLVSWALVTGQTEGDLVELLEHTGQTYQTQAENASAWLRQYVPVIMTGLVAGSLVLLYVLSLFVPYTWLLRSLG